MKKFKFTTDNYTLIVEAIDKEDALCKIMSKIDTSHSFCIPKHLEDELRRYSSRYDYEWEEVYDGINSRVNREGMSVPEAVEDVIECMVIGKSLYENL